MKLTSPLILPALCWSAQLAAASTAHVYTYDPRSQPRPETRSNALEPILARLVLAQRAGVEDYHRSELGREDVIDAINAYGVRTPLFEDKKSRHKRAVILVESGELSNDDVSSLRPYTSFELSPAPGDSAIRGLFVDLVKQSDPASFSHMDDAELYAALSEDSKHSAEGDMFHVAKSVADLRATFTKLAKTDEWSITALMMPFAEIKDTGFMSHGSHWGTYEMPGAPSPLKKRMQVKEEPLTEIHNFRPASSFSAPIPAVAANNTKSLAGILPGCFSSQSACESATRNCTDHGRCTKKYHDGTATRNGVDCYVCACTATKNGQKTTKWGGPACQKKDVSVEFWLIVLFTVGLIGLIGFAIGTIWEMGQQDLPSVIGAGVSGPTART